MTLPLILALLGAPASSTDPNPLPGFQQAVLPVDVQTLCSAPVRYIECFHELLDQQEKVLVPAIELTRDLRTCTVDRDMSASIQGAVDLTTARELPWESTRSRISVRLTAPALMLSAVWDYGIYLLTTPTRELGETPELWAAKGSDKVSLLDVAVSRTYVLAEGTSYTVEMDRILREEIGEPNFIIDQTAAAKVAPADRVWALSDNVTWLTVLNAMAAEINYQPWWMERDGYLHTALNVAPKDRSLTFRFTADGAESNVAPQRSFDRPLSSVPNVWTFYRRSTSQGLAVDDDGLYEVVNQSDGPTSISQRGRRVPKQPEALDAADEDDFKAQADAIVAADKIVAGKLTLSTVFAPSMWQNDAIEYSDAALGGPARYSVDTWSADLTGDNGAPQDMSHTWEAAA